MANEDFSLSRNTAFKQACVNIFISFNNKLDVACRKKRRRNVNLYFTRANLDLTPQDKGHVLVINAVISATKLDIVY